MPLGNLVSAIIGAVQVGTSGVWASLNVDGARKAASDSKSALQAALARQAASKTASIEEQQASLELVKATSAAHRDNMIKLIALAGGLIFGLTTLSIGVLYFTKKSARRRKK